MKMHHLAFLVALALPMCFTTSVLADAQWTGAGGDDLWSNGANWSTGMPPQSATERHNPPAPPNNDNNVARNQVNGSNILIQSGIDAVAFGVQIGYPIDGTLGGQAASNTLTMTGGTLTTQGNFLFNVGRSRNADPNQLVQFNMSGGVVNAAGITIPEAFDPNSVLGFTSVGINAEMHVSGNSMVRTDLLRLGAADSNSVLTISDNARVVLTDENNGFAPGALWIEAFESTPVGSSLVDISGNGQLRVHGEWWTDENANGTRDKATATELQYFLDNYVAPGWIVANGGAGTLFSTFVPTDQSGGGVIIFSAIPEPTTLGLLALACPGLLLRRRK